MDNFLFVTALTLGLILAVSQAPSSDPQILDTHTGEWVTPKEQNHGHE